MPPSSLKLLIRPSLAPRQLRTFAPPRHFHSLSSSQQSRNTAAQPRPSHGPIVSISPYKRRNFHHSPTTQRGGGAVIKQRNKLGREEILDDENFMQRQDNAAAYLENQQLKQDDFGVFPGTVIIATRADWPSWQSQPRARLKMEWQLFKADCLALVGRIYAKSYKGRRNFFRTRVNARQAKQAAVLLHEQLNTATASGNMQGLEDIALSHLYQSLATSISKRAPNITYRWERHGSQPEATVISDRITMAPKPREGSSQDDYLRQAVVRIRSDQSLYLRTRKNDGRGVDEEKVLGGLYDELVVIQKKIFAADEDEEWKIWGTVDETKLEDWERTVQPPIPKAKNIPSLPT